MSKLSRPGNSQEIHGHDWFRCAAPRPRVAQGEALFGLIMTLTFTFGADLVIEAQSREVPARC